MRKPTTPTTEIPALSGKESANRVDTAVVAPTSNSRRCGISEVTSDASSGLIFTRGWVSDPSGIATIVLDGPGGEPLGEVSLTLRRTDIATAPGRDLSEKNGFSATLKAALDEGTRVQARFLDADGILLAKADTKVRLGTVINPESTPVIRSEEGELEARFVISEAALFGRDGDVSVRGWTSVPDRVAAVRLRIGKETLGIANLEVARPDVNEQLGLPPTTRVGFVFAGNAASAKSGKAIEATFIGINGRPIGKAVRAIAQGDRLTNLLFSYDFESRQLRLSGCVFPQKHLRAIAVNFTRGRKHFIRKMFRFCPNEVDQDPFGHTLYSGFADRIPDVGEGDIRAASLDLLYTDGTHHSWSVPSELVQLDSPEAAVEKVAINWMQGEISIRGWMRSREAVTGLELQLNGQTVYGVPELTASARIQKQFGFRGLMAQEFKLTGKMDAAIQDPNALFTTGLSVRLRLMARNRILHEETQDDVPADIHVGSIGFMQFDRRNNVFHASGQIACPIVPSHAQLLVGDRPIDEPLPVQISVYDGIGYFSWTHEVNAAMPLGSRIMLRFQDAEGRVLGALNSGRLEPLFIVGKGNIEGIGTKELAVSLSESYTANRKMSGASICFVLQGRIDAGATGGALLRLVDLMQSFHEAGYATVLIDRSEPWNLLKQPAVYRQFRQICDLHLMVPNGAKREIAEALAKRIEADQRLIPADFKVRGNAFIEALRSGGNGMGAKIESQGLTARIDPEFCIVAAALVNIMMPRAAITTYAWSGLIHEYLRPGIHGMIDTIDVQALRAEVFHKAHADFGSDAVPEPKKFDVELEDELKLLSKAATLIAISRDEQAYLSNHTNPARVVWAGVSARSAATLPRTLPGCHQVLFIGNIYEPNIDGIRKFITEQWPAVLARVPDARLVVAGRVAEALEDLAQTSIEFLGVVEDLHPVYEASAVALNPIRFGTGTSVKLVETLSMGRAMVTTPVGARSFEEAASCGALKVAAIDDFAEAVADLLLDDRARWAMEDEATTFAAARLSPGQMHSDLFNLLESELYYS
jgi:glycosyltransferase involved in cell wall biosynthesis